MTAPVATSLERSQSCIDCHSSYRSPVTGRYVTDEWKLSVHNTGNGAGCADCHEPAPSHPDNCNRCHGMLTPTSTGYGIGVSRNPDKEGRCGKCHSTVAGFGYSVYGNITANTLTRHFSSPTLGSYTASSGRFYPARFVTPNYRGGCRLCHNPHDTSSQIEKHLQWSRSGKGDVTANPWAGRTFRKLGTPLPATPATSFGTECVRCHTATGFISYMNNGTIAPYGGESETEGREVLGCNACHDDGGGDSYGYGLRTVGQVTVYYNLSTTQSGTSTSQPVRYRIRSTEIFTDIKESNICLPCHAGRQTGKTIQAVAAQGADFSRLNFISPHYLAGGATLFQTGGYEFSGRLYPSGGTFQYMHASAGMNNLKQTGTSGPCVTCHLKPGRHSFLPVTRTAGADPWLRQVTGITSRECIKCHDGVTAGTVSAGSLNSSKAGFYAALQVLKSGLEGKNLFYRSGSIFDAATGAGRVTNWVKTPSSGPDLMGAAFNYVLLRYDYGAYLHNVFYARRLMYDSIDMTDDGMLNYSACASVGAGNTVALAYLCSSGIRGSSDERP